LFLFKGLFGSMKGRGGKRREGETNVIRKKII
jgi:hypothetical protein